MLVLQKTGLKIDYKDHYFVNKPSGKMKNPRPRLKLSRKGISKCAVCLFEELFLDNL